MSGTHRPVPAPSAADLQHVTGSVGRLWEDLRGGRLFVTGGTGFVGRWMLETLAAANEELGLGAIATVLSRDPRAFADRASHLAADPAITLVEGDIRSFAFPDGEVTHVLHMATETNVGLSSRMPTLEFDTAVEGTRRVLALAGAKSPRGVLYTSSGAVYGAQPPEVPRVPEDAPLAPPAHDARAAYAHGKRAAEFLCAAANAESGLGVRIARLFAFVGPFLPLDAGYAVGNFLRDALAGEPIRISGDGTPRRSYLYAADLAWWLWTILLAGEPARPYNVGSDADLSVRELAHAVSRTLGHTAGVEVAGTPEPGAPARRYVPDLGRAREELGLSVAVSLEDGVRRTAEWHRSIVSERGA